MDPSLPHRHLLGMATQLLICLTKRLLHTSTQSSGECYEKSCLNILCLLHEAILGHFILEVVYEGQCGSTEEKREQGQKNIHPLIPSHSISSTSLCAKHPGCLK